jgi:hypothetical protein
MARVDSRLIDTSQMAREGSAIFIRSQQVRDQLLNSMTVNRYRFLNRLRLWPRWPPIEQQLGKLTGRHVEPFYVIGKRWQVSRRQLWPKMK